MRRCWENFQCRGVLLSWIIVGQGPTALTVDAGGGCLDIITLVYHFSFLSPSLWETARYRLKYCLEGPLRQKQPTNKPPSPPPRPHEISLLAVRRRLFCFGSLVILDLACCYLLLSSVFLLYINIKLVKIDVEC